MKLWLTTNSCWVGNNLWRNWQRRRLMDPLTKDLCKVTYSNFFAKGVILKSILDTCYSTVTCKVFIESTSTLFNRPQPKLSQTCANSWQKIDRLANNWQACLVLLCATLTPLKQEVLLCSTVTGTIALIYSLGGKCSTLPRGLKALKRESRQKLDAYQHLFYRLQTCPEYLAKLIFALPQSSSNKFLVRILVLF